MKKDVLGLTFEKWDLTEIDFDFSHMPVVMIINSSEMRETGFHAPGVLPRA